jgi:hypothetical protein
MRRSRGTPVDTAGPGCTAATGGAGDDDGALRQGDGVQQDAADR